MDKRHYLRKLNQSQATELPKIKKKLGYFEYRLNKDELFDDEDYYYYIINRLMGIFWRYRDLIKETNADEDEGIAWRLHDLKEVIIKYFERENDNKQI